MFSGANYLILNYLLLAMEKIPDPVTVITGEQHRLAQKVDEFFS